MDKFINLTTNNAKSIRNIYNQKEIDEFIQNIIDKKDVDESNIKQWLKNNLKNYLVKDQPIKLIESLNNILEDWAIAGIKNKTLSNVVLDDELFSKLTHVVDFLRTEYSNKKLSRLSISEAIKQSIDWVEKQKKVSDDPSGVIKINESTNGFHIVELLSEQALKYEGSRMNHCIGLSYSKEVVINKTSRAFSLRDEKNIPHVTLFFNVETGIIEEIKGNSNKEVKPEYQKHLIQFLNDFSFNIESMDDYENITNIDYIDNNFIFNETPSEMRKTEKVFTFKKISLFSLKEKSFVSIKHQDIKDFVNVISITDHDESILNKKFKDLNIKRISEVDINILNKIDVQKLEIKDISHKISKIENNFAKSITIKGGNHMSKIGSMSFEKVEKITINPKYRIEIETLDLSKANNLKFVTLNNVVINNLILPEKISNLEMEDSVIKKIKVNKIDKLKLKNTTLNNELLESKIIFSYESILNENNIFNNELICSDKKNIVISPNKINNEEIKITKPELIKDFLSPLFNKKNTIIVPARYAFSQKKLSPELLMKESLNNKLLTICKKEYQQDVEKLSSCITPSIVFFNKLKTLDCNYLSYKSVDNYNGILNEISINAGFAQYLVSENAYEQFILFEYLRVLNPSGFNLDQFTELLNKPPHDYIKNLIKEIEKDPYYLMNEDYNLVIGDNNKENFEKTYYKIHSRLIVSSPFLNKEKVFKTNLFKKYWQIANNDLIGESFNNELQKTEKTIKNLLNGNVFKNMEKLSTILIKLDDDDYLLSSENKRDLLFNMFDNCSIENKLSEEILQEIFNVITEFKISNILDRASLVSSFVDYTELQYNKNYAKTNQPGSDKYIFNKYLSKNR